MSLHKAKQLIPVAAALIGIGLIIVIFDVRRNSGPKEWRSVVYGAAHAVDAMIMLMIESHDECGEKVTIQDVQSQLQQVVGDFSRIKIYIDPEWQVIITSEDRFRNIILAIEFRGTDRDQYITMTGTKNYSIESSIPHQFILVYQSEE